MNTQEQSVFELYESDVRSYCRSFPVIFNRAKDCYIYDQAGVGYIDFLAGAGSINFGHNNAQIKQAVIDYMNDDGITFSLDMYTDSKKEFINTFYQVILAPRQLNYKMQFTSPSGTSVVESAVKLARKYTQRQNIIAFTNAYHGMSSTALSLTASKGHLQPCPPSGVT